MTNGYMNQRPEGVPAHAYPEVEGPRPYPSESSFDISTDSYAAGWPDTPTITSSAERARVKLLQGTDEQLQEDVIEAEDIVVRRVFKGLPPPPITRPEWFKTPVEEFKPQRFLK